MKIFGGGRDSVDVSSWRDHGLASFTLRRIAGWFETPRNSAAPHDEGLSSENDLIAMSITSAMRREGWAQRST
jgi:hypothetical protein